MENRVVITGLGVVTPEYIGSNPQILIEDILIGNNGRSKETVENLTDKLEEYVSYSLLRRMCRFSQMALYSHILCKLDSGIEIKDENELVGSIMNTSYGPLNVTEKLLETIITAGPQEVSPMDFSNTVNNCATGQVSISLGLKGVSTTLVGSSGVTYAFDLIKHNKVQAVLVSGVEELNNHVKDIAVQYDCAVKEESCCLMLENYEHAQKRNASIYAEIVGCKSCYVNNENADDMYGTLMARYETRRLVYANSSILNKRINSLLVNRPKGYFDIGKYGGCGFGATETENCIIAAAMLKEKKYLMNNSNNTEVEEISSHEDDLIIAVSIQQGNAGSLIKMKGWV